MQSQQDRYENKTQSVAKNELKLNSAPQPSSYWIKPFVI